MSKEPIIDSTQGYLITGEKVSGKWIFDAYQELLNAAVYHPEVIQDIEKYSNGQYDMKYLKIGTRLYGEDTYLQIGDNPICKNNRLYILIYKASIIDGKIVNPIENGVYTVYVETNLKDGFQYMLSNVKERAEKKIDEANKVLRHQKKVLNLFN